MSLIALLLTATPAEAIIYVGNPNLAFYVDRQQGDLLEGEVHLDTVRVRDCGGGYVDYAVDEVIDPVAGFELPISAGNYCGVTLYWSTDMILEVSGTQGDFTMVHGDASTDVTLGTPTPPVALTPIEVVSGQFYGNNPGLFLSIQ